MIYFHDSRVTLYNTSCRSMSDLPDESVQCVVTSPPYWGLRKYAGEQDSVWGIKTNPDGTHELCNHKWGSLLKKNTGTLGNNLDTLAGSQTAVQAKQANVQGCFCSLCGAWRGGYGLEPTVQMYVQHSIEILREVRRVLRKDGVCFWNLGDSYAGSGGEHKAHHKNDAGFQYKNAEKELSKGRQAIPCNNGIKAKDLCLIPQRVAIAAQEDGWWVRSIIIWSKNNPMPESVTDRPTESHEYIIMLTKSARYHWDAEAVREDGTGRNWAKSGGNLMGSGLHKLHDGFEVIDRDDREDACGRNLRSVWSFPTKGYAGAHFATFPEKLPETCIKAATPEYGCCSKCGKPWERIVEKFPTKHDGFTLNKERDDAQSNGNRLAMVRQHIRELGMEQIPPAKTIGWQPGCKCEADVIPSIVLDPFAGSGTTLWVAKKLNRRSVGYEISGEYCKLAVERNRQDVLL